MKTYNYVKETLIQLIRKYKPLMAIIKRRKMSYYGHICRHKTMTKTIIQGKVERTRAIGRTKKEYFGCQRY